MDTVAFLNRQISLAMWARMQRDAGMPASAAVTVACMWGRRPKPPAMRNN